LAIKVSQSTFKSIVNSSLIIQLSLLFIILELKVRKWIMKFFFIIIIKKAKDKNKIRNKIIIILYWKYTNCFCFLFAMSYSARVHANKNYCLTHVFLLMYALGVNSWEKFVHKIFDIIEYSVMYFCFFLEKQFIKSLPSNLLFIRVLIVRLMKNTCKFSYKTCT
jgi:hypothetical protein